MIFELYPEGWVGFHQADRREEREFQAEGTACAKASISYTNVEFGFFFS